MGSRTIGNLNVKLSGDPSGFSASMKTTRREIAATNEAIESGSRSLKAFYQTQERMASRGYQEQRVRDEMAKTIKSMREQTAAATATAEARRRLFGDQASAPLVKNLGEAAKQSDKLHASLTKLLGGAHAERLQMLGQSLGISGRTLAVGAGALAMDRAIREAVTIASKDRISQEDVLDAYDATINKVPILGLPTWLGTKAVRDDNEKVRKASEANRASRERYQDLQKVRQETKKIADAQIDEVTASSEFLKKRKEINDSYKETVAIVEKLKQAGDFSQAMRLGAVAIDRLSKDMDSLNAEHKKKAITGAFSGAVSAVSGFAENQMVYLQSSATYRRVAQFFEQFQNAQATQERVDQSLEDFFDGAKPEKKKPREISSKDYEAPALMTGNDLARRLAGGVTGEDLAMKQLDEQRESKRVLEEIRNAVTTNARNITIFGF